MKKIVFILSLFFIGNTFATPYEVSVKTISPNIIPRNAVRVPILEITLDTKNEDLSISSLEIERKGLSNNNSFSRVWAESKSFRRTLKTKFGVNSVAKLRFSTPLFISRNSQEKLYVLTNLSSQSSLGSTFSFSVNAINESNQSVSIFQKTIPKKQIILPQKTRKPRLVCKNRKCSWVKN